MINYHLKVRQNSIILGLFLALSLAALLWLRHSGTAQAPSAEGGLFYELTGLTENQCVGLVDGEEIPARLYLFYLACSCRYWDGRMYEENGKIPDWSAPMPDGVLYGDFLQQEAWSLVFLQITVEHLARDYDIALSPAAQQALQREEAEYIRRCGSEEALDLALAAQGIDRATFDRLRQFTHLYQTLLKLAESEGSPLHPREEELLSFGTGQDYLSWDLLLLRNSDDQGQPLDEAQRQKTLQKLQALLYQLQRSPDPAGLFTQLASLYSQDSRRILKPEGYTCPAQEVPQIFRAVLTLEENGFSQVVETADGWWILFRRPLQTPELIAPYFAHSLRQKAQCITWNSRLPSQLDLSAFYRAVQTMPDFPSA